MSDVFRPGVSPASDGEDDRMPTGWTILRDELKRLIEAFEDEDRKRLESAEQELSELRKGDNR